MKKTIEVKRHVRGDGSVVEAHEREIELDEPKSLSEEIKQRKRELEQANLLNSFLEEK